MTFKRSIAALAGLLSVALLMLAAADAAASQQMVQTQTIALDSLTHQSRGQMKWSHGADRTR